MRLHTAVIAAAMLVASNVALAQKVEDLSETIEKFRGIPSVAPYFGTAYAYAVWPKIGRGGLGIGGASGKGQVYLGGKVTSSAVSPTSRSALRPAGKRTGRSSSSRTKRRTTSSQPVNSSSTLRRQPSRSTRARRRRPARRARRRPRVPAAARAPAPVTKAACRRSRWPKVA